MKLPVKFVIKRDQKNHKEVNGIFNTLYEGKREGKRRKNLFTAQSTAYLHYPAVGKPYTNAYFRPLYGYKIIELSEFKKLVLSPQPSTVVEGFTVGGNIFLKKAFLEELGVVIPIISQLESNYISDSSLNSSTLGFSEIKKEIHFNLPEQYNEAIAYVKRLRNSLPSIDGENGVFEDGFIVYPKIRLPISLFENNISEISGIIFKDGSILEETIINKIKNAVECRNSH